jgi:hypothetical protein
MSNEEDTKQDATGTVPDPGAKKQGCAQRLWAWLKSLFGK